MDYKTDDVRRVVIPFNIQHLITQHAMHVYPQECCGLIAGDKRAEEYVSHIFYPFLNIAPDPTKTYVAWPEAMDHLWENGIPLGLEPIAIYHSHPTTSLKPSETDIKFGQFPELVYIICNRQEIKAWRITEKNEVFSVEIKPR